MRDYAKKILLSNHDFSKVEGRTRIELTNVKTGEKKIIEHKNTFQSSVLAAQLRSLGAANNSPWSNSTWAGRPLWRNLLGGILLFRDEITPPASYAPTTNLMVANGSFGVTNNGAPAELGSYNSIESSTSGSNSLSFVYDWGTSQGNGTISCVCLTSELGGYLGYGNASGESATRRSIDQDQSGNQTGAHLYYNGKKIRVVSVDYTAKKITIAKSNDQLGTASVFYGQNETQEEIAYTGNPIGSGTGNTFAAAISSTEIMIFKSAQANTIPNGGSGGFIIYNAASNTASVETITNTSGKTVEFYAGQKLRVMRSEDGGLYTATSDSGIALFDSNGEFVRNYAGIGGDSCIIGTLIPGMVFAAPNNSASMYFLYGAEARPTNGNAPAQMVYNAAIDAIGKHDNSEIYGAAIADKLIPFKSPLYLATINNLDSPVTKDSTQTMKVIYTLTEAS